MNQRQFPRRGDIEHSSSEFRIESVTLQAIVPCVQGGNSFSGSCHRQTWKSRLTLAPVSNGRFWLWHSICNLQWRYLKAREKPPVARQRDEFQFSRSNSQRQRLRQLRGGEEFQGELLNSAGAAAVMNRRFSLLDILRETLYLARARRTYILVSLSVYILGELLLQGSWDYLAFGDPSREARRACVRDILDPWKVAARNSSTFTFEQQEEFYSLFQQNCTQFFKSPAEEMGFYHFRNGTMEFDTPTGFARALPVTRNFYGGFLSWRQISWIISLMWTIWCRVALTWGLHFASTRTKAYRPPQNLDSSMRTKRSPSQTLMEVFRDLFAFRVLQGVVRVTFTETLIFWMSRMFYVSVFIFRMLVKHNDFDRPSMHQDVANTSHWWELADPITFLFLLSSVGAALEPGMWGVKALGRGFEMAKGNRIKSYLIFSLLLFWSRLDYYLTELVAESKQDEMTEALWRSVQLGSITAMGSMPGFILVPVFYFLCTSRNERLDTMK